MQRRNRLAGWGANEVCGIAPHLPLTGLSFSILGSFEPDSVFPPLRPLNRTQFFRGSAVLEPYPLLNAPSLKDPDMPRPKSLEYAAQLEARARDIRNTEARRRRAADTRVKVLMGALALSYASTLQGGPRLLEALAKLPALSKRDARYLADNLPPALAVPFAAAVASAEDSTNV